VFNHLDLFHLDALLDCTCGEILQVYRVVPVNLLKKSYSLLIYHVSTDKEPQPVSFKKFDILWSCLSHRKLYFHLISLGIGAFDLQFRLFLVLERFITNEFFLKQELLHELCYRHAISLHHKAHLECFILILWVKAVDHKCKVLSFQNHSSFVFAWRHIDTIGTGIHIEGGVELLLKSCLSKLDSQISLKWKLLCKTYWQFNGMHLYYEYRALFRLLSENI